MKRKRFKTIKRKVGMRKRQKIDALWSFMKSVILFKFML